MSFDFLLFFGFSSTFLFDDPPFPDFDFLDFPDFVFSAATSVGAGGGSVSFGSSGCSVGAEVSAGATSSSTGGASSGCSDGGFGAASVEGSGFSVGGGSSA